MVQWCVTLSRALPQIIVPFYIALFRALTMKDLSHTAVRRAALKVLDSLYFGLIG